MARSQSSCSAARGRLAYAVRQGQVRRQGFGHLRGHRQNSWIKTARCWENEVEATMVGKLKTMPTSSLSVALQHLLADLRPEGAGMTDGELLARFLRSRDEDAL